jgi:hypothetical protein
LKQESRALGGFPAASHTGRWGALSARVASYYHRAAKARSWGNGRATRASRKTSSMSMAIRARAAERNGRRGDHTKPKDAHHPHHAYRVVWMGCKNPI